jgi:hypothetical protein
MSVASNDFPDISFAHLHSENYLATLLHPADEHFFRSLDQLTNDILEKSFHWNQAAGTAFEFFFRAFKIMLVTVALGRAPFRTQCSARVKSSVKFSPFCRGSYLPIASINFPSRGLLLSATTTR